jgi:coiled-coil domain-containing protein 63/114
MVWHEIFVRCPFKIRYTATLLVRYNSHRRETVKKRNKKMATESELRMTELQQLHREYRNMEINRRAYAEESQLVLRKQQLTMEKMRKDIDGLKSEIAMLMRSTNKNMSGVQQDIINKLQDQGDKMSNSVDFERRNIQTMEEQIHIMKQKVLQQRKSMGGVNASKENHHMIQKQIRILENRLDKSLMKFNEAIAHNKTLRDNIDDLRRERVVFENIYRKMERELQEKKQKMAEIIELSNQSYEQRDSYQMEVAAIEQANKKEQEEFEEQMVELGRMLETELRLPNHNSGGPGTRPSTRSGLTLQNPNDPQANITTGGGGGGGTQSLSGTGGGGVGGGVGTNSWNQNTEKMDILTSYERVQNFEEAFNKIKAATGISDIDELVKTFIKNEDHNFSLFNYVNEQNNEIEKLDEQIQLLREEERKYAHESGEDVHQHKQILKELEMKLQASESMAEKYEIRCQDLQRIIESLKRGIQSIYEKISIDDEEEEEGGALGMGGGGGGGSLIDPTVTESNMVHYLGIIEQQANKILKNYAVIRQSLLQPSGGLGSSMSAPAFTHAGDGAGDGSNDGNLSPSSLALKSATLTSVLGTGPKAPMGQDLLHVNPPKLDDYQSDDDDEDDDDDTRPLTREELKARTLNRLQKKGHGGGGGGGKGKGKGGVKKTMVQTR